MINAVRGRWHASHWAGEVKSLRWLIRKFDSAVERRFAGISHPLYVSAVKDWFQAYPRLDLETKQRTFTALARMGGFKTYADVGADIGFYGFTFRELGEDHSVIMVEPDPDNAALIRKTIERGRIRFVELVEAAVADKAGRVTFYRNDPFRSNGSIVRDLVRDHGEPSAARGRRQHSDSSVRSTTLDLLFDGHRSDPDFIKLDVEGAEMQVLRGARKVISRSKPAILLECDQDQAEVHSFLSDLGYVYFDFFSLKRVREMPHYSLALSTVQHAELIERLDSGQRAA